MTDHQRTQNGAGRQTITALRADNHRLMAELEQARADPAEEPGLALQRLQVIVRELEGSNQALRQANQHLEQGVADRTAAVAAANAELTEQNHTLEQRVLAEIAAREAAQTARFHHQKLEALGQLTGGVAHDFNNLLTVVLSGLHLLQRAHEPERRERLLSRIGDAAERGAKLTHRLLAFGRRQHLRPTLLDLGARLGEMGELLAHSLRADLRIVTTAAPGLWPICVDHGELELALLNLALNSRDAMPLGGTIRLEAVNRVLSTAQAGPLDLPAGRYVALSVADTGTGMAPEVRARVFEPFFTTRPVGQGSGLGLSQIYGFAQQSGGIAQIASEPGEGCTVTLLLPAAELEGIAEPPSEPDTAEDATETDGGASILLVEDDFEVAALASDLLTQFGHAVTRVGSLEAALGALSNDRPIDLLFADVLLPGGGSGIDLAHEVERRRPGLPILLTTGYGGEAVNMRRIRWPLLHKPYQPEELRIAVAQGLSGHTSA